MGSSLLAGLATQALCSNRHAHVTPQGLCLPTTDLQLSSFSWTSARLRAPVCAIDEVTNRPLNHFSALQLCRSYLHERCRLGPGCQALVLYNIFVNVLYGHMERSAAVVG